MAKSLERLQDTSTNLNPKLPQFFLPKKTLLKIYAKLRVFGIKVYYLMESKNSIL